MALSVHEREEVMTVNCTWCSEPADVLCGALNRWKITEAGDVSCRLCGKQIVLLAATKDVEVSILAKALARASAATLPYVQLLDALRNLARSNHLSDRDRLYAVDWAITMALASDPDDADAWAYQVSLGYIGPWDREL